MKVFVTGGTGFVGSHLLPALLEAGHEVQALVRPGSENKLSDKTRNHSGFNILEGDALDPDSLKGMDPGAEAVIHLVGIIREQPWRGITYEKLHIEAVRNVIAAAKRIDPPVRRFLHMSALGTRIQARSQYHRTNYLGEHYVKHSRLPWTVFRPSLIFGPGDEFVSTLKRLIGYFLPVIVPGSGKTRFQPVAVENVVEGFVKALEADDAKVVGRIFEVGGPECLTFDEMVDIIAEARGVNGYYKIHVPMFLIMPPVFFLQKLPFFPLTCDQLVLLQEDNVGGSRKFYDELNIEPKTFTAETLRGYI